MKPAEYVTQVLVTESREFSNPFLDKLFSLNEFVSKLFKKPETLAARMAKKRNIRLNHASIGMMTEVGELFEMLDKAQLDLANLREEAGDATWYMALAVDELAFDLEKLMTKGYQAIAMSGYTTDMDDAAKRVEITKILGESTKIICLMLDVMKKTAFYGREMKIEVFESGISDLMAQMMLLLQLGGFNIEDTFDVNIAKLQKKRFKQGKFTAQEAIVRDLVEERKTLEGKD